MIIRKCNKVRNIILLLLAYQSYWKFLCLCHIALAQKKRKTRIWTQFIYTENERQLHGFFSKLFPSTKIVDTDEFRKATRMGIHEFMLLKQLIEKRIMKKDFIRQSISPECRLAITLVYLGHGVSRQLLARSFRVGVSTIRQIILETCDAIWDELAGIYLAPPNEEKWETIANEFFDKTGMPHVVGAIDGKHVQIKCPPKSGSLYFNYKQYFSIVLLASCDSNYTFTAVDVGAYGNQSDGGLLKASGFGNAILREIINIPKPKPLPNTNIKFPYYFIGDATFPLKNNIMRPYPGRNLAPDKENFNKRLARARVQIENTFGILTARWRVLTNTLNVFPENAEKIVKATIILHNFVKLHDPSIYCPCNYVDQISKDDVVVKGSWRQEVTPLQQTRLFSRFNAPRNAFAMRDILKDHLYT